MGFLSRIFSNNEKSKSINLGDLITDIHSHLIPGIDDGSQSLDDSIAMLHKFKELGYKKVITTPHIMSDHYRNTPEIILNGLEVVRAELKRINLDIEIEAAAEYFFDETIFEKIRNRELLTFNGNHVLVEFSFFSMPQGEENLFFELLTNGYQPVLAHFERYAFLHGSIEKAIEWRNKGIYIQMNLNSLSGHYGPEVKKQAEKLIQAEAIDFVGTDCHRIEHLLLLEKQLSTPLFHKLIKLNFKNQQL
ncbi:MAG: capsular biosynthesis protein [Flavobacteriia bacterium]|nr:capsular biosynthesis protein [Flavobacteriia bacterium]